MAIDQVEPPGDALAFAASTAAQELRPQWLTNHREWRRTSCRPVPGSLSSDNGARRSRRHCSKPLSTSIRGLGFKHAFCKCMQGESQTMPNSRMGLYVRRLGFLDLIRQAPFDE
jgi:hypothetical protein